MHNYTSTFYLIKHCAVSLIFLLVKIFQQRQENELSDVHNTGVSITRYNLVYNVCASAPPVTLKILGSVPLSPQNVAEWTPFSENLVGTGIEPETSGYIATNSDHQTTDAVGDY
jgi:hypothetical protein